MKWQAGLGCAAVLTAAVGLGTSAMGSYCVVSYDYYVDYHYADVDDVDPPDFGGSTINASSPLFFSESIESQLFSHTAAEQSTMLTPTTISSFGAVEGRGGGWPGTDYLEERSTSYMQIVFDLDGTVDAQLVGELAASFSYVGTSSTRLMLQRDGDADPIYSSSIELVDMEEDSLAIEESLILAAGRWTLTAIADEDAEALSIGDAHSIASYDFTLTIPGPGAAALLAFGLVSPRRRRR
jgi:hypothetical protein